jgi:hypothetical protein
MAQLLPVELSAFAQQLEQAIFAALQPMQLVKIETRRQSALTTMFRSMAKLLRNQLESGIPDDRRVSLFQRVRARRD